MYLSVIIPAFKEENRIPATLDKVKAYLSKQSYDWEIIIVNDGSPDNTGQVVAEKIKGWQNFYLIDNKINQGKGAAVKQGMIQAKGEWRLFMDADSSTDISELPKLLKFANQKNQISNSNQIPNSKLQKFGNCDLNGHCDLEFGAYDVVIGSRYLDKGSIKVKQPLLRRIVSRLGNVLIRVLLGIKSADTQCGFKLFSANFVQEIFPRQTINRWGFDVEILAIGIKKGYKIKEVPVDWYDAEGSTVKKSAALQTLKEIFIIKWNMIRGKYS